MIFLCLVRMYLLTNYVVYAMYLYCTVVNRQAEVRRVRKEYKGRLIHRRPDDAPMAAAAEDERFRKALLLGADGQKFHGHEIHASRLSRSRSAAPRLTQA